MDCVNGDQLGAKRVEEAWWISHWPLAAAGKHVEGCARGRDHDVVVVGWGTAVAAGGGEGLCAAVIAGGVRRLTACPLLYPRKTSTPRAQWM